MLFHDSQLKSRVNRNMEEKVIVDVCGLPELYIYIISVQYNIQYQCQKLCVSTDDVMNHKQTTCNGGYLGHD